MKSDFSLEVLERLLRRVLRVETQFRKKTFASFGNKMVQVSLARWWKASRCIVAWYKSSNHLIHLTSRRSKHLYSLKWRLRDVKDIKGNATVELQAALVKTFFVTALCNWQKGRKGVLQSRKIALKGGGKRTNVILIWWNNKCTFLFSSFRRVLNVMFSFLGNSPASEFYLPTFRNSLSVPSS